MLVAHRGFRNPKAENRMVDFSTALETCKAVEFDIRMTKDKKIIIFHDHNFNRIGKINKSVRSFTYEEIKNIEFFKKNPEWLPPLFYDDFIKKLSSQYEMINVEIKPDRYNKEEFSQILGELNLLSENTKAEIVVSSFGLDALKFISKLKAPFKKGYLCEALSTIDMDLIKSFDYLHPYVGTLKLKASIEIIKKLNMPLNIWTFKKDEDVVLLKQNYSNLIANYISDNPNLKI